MSKNCHPVVCRKFTFAELVSVMIVTIICFAVLIPALITASDNSANVLCIANMKKIGTAFISYSADNNDWIAPNYLVKNKSAYFWQDLIYPYTEKNTSVYLCPAQNPIQKKFTSMKGLVKASYATSSYVGGHGTLTKHYPFRQIKDYPSPMLQLLALDATGNDGKEWFYSIAWWNIPRKNDQLGTNMMKKVHGEFVNVLLLDGHVDGAKWSDLNPDINERMYSWNAAQNKAL